MATENCAYLDWTFFGFWACVLVVITVVLEKLFHFIEHALSHRKLGHKIYEKMVKVGLHLARWWTWRDARRGVRAAGAARSVAV